MCWQFEAGNMKMLVMKIVRWVIVNDAAAVTQLV